MRIIVTALLVSVITFQACEKTNDSNIIGKYFDQELLGKWVSYYSTTDMHNSITCWMDSIRFSENNSGCRKIYRFSELEEDIPFKFYTQKDSLFINVEQNSEKWIYSIRNDSLIMTKLFSSYSSYIEFRVYQKEVD